MKAVILAGGLGTRLSEETVTRPKPMVEIGGRPILWHILKIYSSHGINDFVICAGYKGYVIKEYFANYFLHMSDVTFDMKENRMEVHSKRSEPWRVTIIDTGDDTLTGGRLKRVAPYVDGTFCMTYGDGVADVNIAAGIEFHRKKGLKATLTAVQPSGRFGALGLDNGKVASFQEKPQGDGAWINGGFFVLEPSVFDYIEDDDTIWERAPLERLSREGQLAAYEHTGFWQPMDIPATNNQQPVSAFQPFSLSAFPRIEDGLLTAYTGSFGDLSTQSFYPPHHLTMGEGGAVNIIRRASLKSYAESFRDWGRDCWCPSGKDNTCNKRFGWQLGELPEGYDHKYIYSHMGYNLKPLDPQAAIGRVQLRRLPACRVGAGTSKSWEDRVSGCFGRDHSTGKLL